MATYVCRTCLYVSRSVFSFKELKKVKPILELFVPETKIYDGTGSLICDHCVTFLKKVEKFKATCLESQNKLYSMKLLTIKDNHKAILKPATTRAPRAPQQRRKRSTDPNKDPKKTKLNATVTSTSDITLTSLLKSAPKSKAPQNISSAADDLLRLFDIGNDTDSAANNEADKQVTNVSTVSDLELIMNYDDEPVEDELGAVLKDDDNTSPELDKGEHLIIEDSHEGDSEIVSLSSANGEETSSTEATSSNTENISGFIKTECEENPGFFNKKSTDGFYKCRLCKKMYRNSKRLYNHTREKHSNQVKLHHCYHCSFFTIWKSALVRHCSVFHEDILQGTNLLSFNCYHCAFQSRSKDQLSQHILDKHRQDKFTRCPFCRRRFSDNASFAKHVEKEHLDLDMAISSNYCSECGVLFLTEEDYNNHMTDKHSNFICVICNKSYECNAELLEHRRNIHATSFGASKLP